MPQNFIAVGREQELLLPPSLREWLSKGHFAWFVLDAVEQMDLSISMPPTVAVGTAARRTSRG